MTSRKQVSFETFIDYFPSIDLPVLLTDSTATEFSKYNEPFANQIIHEYFSEWDNDIDEFTEFIPCFSIPDTGDFVAIVYYKATLLNYGFVIVSFTKNGDLISVKQLNIKKIKGDIIENSATVIDEDWIIKIIAGTQDVNEQDYNPENSKMTSLEILPTGEIVHRLSE